MDELPSSDKVLVRLKRVWKARMGEEGGGVGNCFQEGNGFDKERRWKKSEVKSNLSTVPVPWARAALCAQCSLFQK